MWKLLIMLFLAVPAWGASVYKCTQPDGSVTFSDIACPSDTVDHEYRGNIGPAFRGSDRSYNPNSLTEQARRIDARKHREKLQRAERRRSVEPGPVQPFQPLVPTAPAVSYDAALAQALKETGYRDYRQLSDAQRRKVHSELSKYGYRPRKPVEVKPKQPPAWVVEEQERRDEADEIKRTFEKEQQWRNLGVQGREGRYRDAVDDCEQAMANCW